MASNGAAPVNGSDPLYGWWLEAVPNFLSGLRPPAAAPAEASAAAPSPLGHVTQALGLAQGMIKPVSEAMLQALALNQTGEAFNLLEELLQGWMGGVTDRLAKTTQASAQPGFAALGGWANAPWAAFAHAMQPLSLNLERTFGGLADAFGLASSRDLQQALRDMSAASMAHRQAQAEYLGLIAGALAKGNDGLLSKLAEMGQRGESVDSVKALVRLWARAADGAMHSAMQSPGALEAAARLVRTATRSRQQQHRIVAIASTALNVPTRAEVDDAYREIQELKREVRRLRRSIAPELALEAPAARAAAKTPAKRAKAPAAVRKPTTARKSGQKAAAR